MKNLITILILIFYLSWIFAPMVKVGDYYFNLKEYKENCINKQKPKLKCDGKCQLVKNVLEEDDSKPMLNLFNYDFSIAFILNIFQYKASNQINISEYNQYYFNIYKFKFYLTLFKPPIN